MSLKAWRTVATPHEDVLQNTFSQADFAVDLSQIHQGEGSLEYRDPVKFFQRTYITEGMGLLLHSLFKRLSGMGGDPIIQLQTAFGGGKTHTLLSVYHLAKAEVPVCKLEGIAPIIDDLGLQEIPKAKVAVIDGINFSPTEPKRHGEIQCHTLWGELAYQLSGEEGYALVESSDKYGTSPDKDTLISLFKNIGPTVILIDELVAFLRNFKEGEDYPAGSIESNMTFIQALTESVKIVPNAILFASLPDSHNAGEGRGQAVLAQVETYFSRLHMIWKPVTKEEAFHIVRRRLFNQIIDPKAQEETCTAYAQFYIHNPDKFPEEALLGDYKQRLMTAYPIHPEIFDRLYEDWSTLQNFQKTRGVLQLLAQAIHRLWKDSNQDPLIMPGSLPLYDSSVKNKSIEYLSNNWDPVVDSDIDGELSVPMAVESKETRFGQHQVARRLSRTIFLGSAPHTKAQSAWGIKVNRILLGSVLPETPISLFEDGLKRLANSLSYLNVEADRFWFGVTPNLRQEMESRKSRFDDKQEVYPLIRNQLAKMFKRDTVFSSVHVFSPSGDIPDDKGNGLRLVILPPKALYRKNAGDTAIHAAQEILKNRDQVPRIHRNRIIFLAPDFDSIQRLIDQIRTLLAWQSIINDVDKSLMNLDNFQLKNAKKSLENTENQIPRLCRECYKWILHPMERKITTGEMELIFEDAILPTGGVNATRDLEELLLERNQWVTKTWGPSLLKVELDKYFFKPEVDEVSAYEVWEKMCNHPFFPKVINENVFLDTLLRGVENRDYFALADGKTADGRYIGFIYGSTTLNLALDRNLLIIKKDRAEEFQQILDEEERQRQQTTGNVPIIADPIENPISPIGTGTSPIVETPTGSNQRNAPKQFFASKELVANTALSQFMQIQEEILQQLALDQNVNINVKIEISAEHTTGFDEGTVRTIKENSGVLGFRNAEFD